MVWGHAMVKVGRSESRLVVSVKGKRATGAIMCHYASFSKCHIMIKVLMSEC